MLKVASGGAGLSELSGSFAPTLTSRDGSISSISSLSGKYTKQGSLVSLVINASIATNGTGAGEVLIGNLPFPAVTGTNFIGTAVARTPLGFLGTPVTWGNNAYGQLNIPSDVSTNVTKISAGGMFNLALKNGKVHGWGRADYGQTSIPTAANTGVTDISASMFHGLALKAGGVIAWGANWSGQTVVPAAANSDVVSIAAGTYHSLALKSDGSVIGWGGAAEGQINIPAAALSGVTAIAAGAYHSLALKAGGVLAWGGNTQGQISVPAAASSNVIAIASFDMHSLALKSDGTLVAWGSTTHNATTPIPPSINTGVSAIAVGAKVSMALQSGAVRSWGSAVDGQLTIPTSALSNVVQLDAGNDHSIALINSGESTTSVSCAAALLSGESSIRVVTYNGAYPAADSVNLTIQLDYMT